MGLQRDASEPVAMEHTQLVDSASDTTLALDFKSALYYI
jgi:hypothetical protein